MTDEFLSDDEYAGAQSRLFLFVPIVADEPYGQMLQKINHCDSIGPILNPTLYMRGAERMHAFGDLVLGAATFQAAAIKFREELQSIEAKEANIPPEIRKAMEICL